MFHKPLKRLRNERNIHLLLSLAARLSCRILERLSPLLSARVAIQAESETFLRTALVSVNARYTIDELFERAYDEGIEVDSEFYDNYRHIKEHLRTQAVTLSERDRADIPDWNSFRKSAFGNLF